MKCCKDIANFLLWVVWESLIIPINNDSMFFGNLDAQSAEINSKVILMFICM